MDEREQCDARSVHPAPLGAEQSRCGYAPAIVGSGPSARTITVEDVIGYEALYESMMKCLCGVRWKGRSAYWQMHWPELIGQLYDELHDGTYRQRPTTTFEVTKPKPRTILAIDIRDRIVQRSFNDNLIYPVMSRSWIYDNCACQTGKGTDFAMDRLAAHLERHWRAHGMTGGAMTGDIAGYYANMDHETTEADFARKLPPWGSSYVSYSFGQQYQGERGYNPGSQMVQIAGINYLDPMDHFIKEKLHIRGYIRYMDDFILLHEDMDYLAECREAIADKLAEVGLHMHPVKTRIQPIGDTITFLGFDYSLKPDGHAVRFVKKSKVKEARREMAAMSRLVRSGRMTYEQFDVSHVCRVAHMARGDNKQLLMNMDGYRDYLLGGIA